MKILFVYPRFTKYLESFPGERFEGAERFEGYSYPPALGIPTLIALTPERHEVEFVDENIEEIDFATDADLIAVSFFTPQAAFAYDICDRFRELGKRVIVGGLHASVLPDEAATHADIVCVGEAELIWPGILEDIERGEHRSRYRQSCATPSAEIPMPARSAIYEHPAGGRYQMLLDYLELSRGCDMRCGSCVVPKVSGRSVRYKDIGQIVEEVASMAYPMCFIADDVVFMQYGKGDPAARSFLLEVFGEIARLGLPRGFTTSTIPMYEIDAELAEVMGRAGATVSYTTFGFDPISNAAITRGSPRFRQMITNQTKLLQDAGILVYAAFHLGFDDHTPAIVDNIRDFCVEAGIVLAQFCLRIPWPGTVMWDDLARQDRILHTDWRRYNGASVTFAPKGMTATELEDAFVTLWHEYSARFHMLNDLQRTQVPDYEMFVRHARELASPPTAALADRPRAVPPLEPVT